MPDPGQKDSNVIRYEDQEVRRSNTVLTDEGPQGGGSYPLNECQLGTLLVGGGAGGGHRGWVRDVLGAVGGRAERCTQ
jgi:hypothetical protein